MKKHFILKSLWILLVSGIYCLLLQACNNSTATSEELKEKLSTLPDSIAIQDALREELHVRTTDSLQQAQPMAAQRDSIITLGDTVTWRVTTRTGKPNTELAEFSTDTLRKVFREKTIYLKDDRQDWFELGTEPELRQTSLQSVCLIAKDKLKKRADGKYVLRARPFREAKRLCTADRFKEQPVGGFCSGFAVGKRTIVTAGHCVTATADLANFYLVFNFRQEEEKKTSTVFDAKDVYIGVKIIQRAETADKRDFAVLEVDHDIESERIARVRASDVSLGEAVFVIGYPCGLPVKITGDATVISNGEENFYLADVDTFGGNSGSPVYDSQHAVVGILVRGGQDFSFHPGQDCYFSYVCNSPGAPGCEGEGISRTSQFISFLPPTIH